MTLIRQWLDEVRLGKLSLVELVARINQRARIDAAEHRRELDELDQLLRDNGIDPRLHRAVRAKLAELQAAQGLPADAAQDRTVYTPPAAAPTAASSDDEDDGRTVLSPQVLKPREPAPPPAPTGAEDDEDDDATRMLTPEAPADDATRVLPGVGASPASTVTSVTGSNTAGTQQRTGTTGSTGTSSSGSRASSWQRLAQADAPTEQVGVGTRLKDRFVLEKLIGQGGMGVVFLALDERKVEARDRNPRVAVKVLNDEFRQHPDSLIALQRESRRSQQLAHDNIVRVYDFDKDGATVFMTMEYVDGEDLKSLIKSLDGKGMPMAEAFPIIEGMGRALERAHRDGVVHSDFKPGNVMLTSTRMPKVFDFGIARAGKHRADAHGEQTVFDAGTLGALTPAYASLEMLRGEDPEPADDLYALACVVYELLSGRHPYNKINAEQAQKQGLAPARIPGLTKLQWRTLSRGLAFRRQDRIATAGELIEGLRPRTQREKMLPLVLAGAGGVAALALLIWLGLSLYYNNRLAGVEACIGSRDCADAEVLARRLQGLKAEDQKRLLETRRDEIKGVFYGTLAQHWAPDQGRYQYARARKVVEIAIAMYGLDSAWVKELGDGLEAGRNTQLSRLNDAFSKQIDVGVFVDAQDDGRALTSVLDAVRTIDPAQPLLKDGRIGPAFERGIRNGLQDPQLAPAAQLELAQKRIEIARRHVPDPTALKRLDADLATRREQIAAMAVEEQRLAAARAQRQQRIEAVSGLLRAPSNTPEWRKQLRERWTAARESAGKDDPELAKLRDSLASALLAQSAQNQSGGQLEAASEAAQLGVELLPDNQSLDRQLKTVVAARDQRIAQAATESDRLRLNLARLDQLLAYPAATAAWVGEVDAAFKTVAGKVPAADIAGKRDQLAQAAARLVGDTVARSDFAAAEAIAAHAAAIDPADARLAALPARVADGRRKVQSAQIARLRELAQRKSFTPEWQKSVEVSVAALRGVEDPALPPLLESLGAAYAARADELAKAKTYAAARQVIEAGSRLLPQSAAVKSARGRLDQLEQQDRAADQALQTQFKVQELERTIALKSAAAEINDAIAALQQLRRLDDKNAYAASEAPRQIADGALKLSERLAAKNDYDNAIKAVDRGLEVLRTPALAQARARYETAGCAADLDRELRRRGSLGDARRAECLALLKNRDPAQYGKYKSLETPAPAPAPAPATAPAPAPAPQAAPTPAPAPAPEVRVAPSGPDPCKKSYSGDGAKRKAQCADEIVGQGTGPVVVVVAGLGTYGMTQSEISNFDFARYCRASGQCAAPAGDPYLPVTRVSPADARGFARWLSNSTGRTYRLPSEDEWVHAASVGGRDPFVEGYCKAESGGSGPRQITAGVMNKWGLVNTAGNVWELVDNGGAFLAVGGSYQDDARDCDTGARRAVSGPDPAIGFRLLRELD